ncbi:toprim domain-containing protein [Mycolicibacterium mucogenicum]|uniref:toprim domain-containing protein n=1 Tax=Mycolicibacterium mucogenicum TaxID=56689 RepID=UPI001F2162C4|nr:toprim domain-containing protein [Mycolicibacterium mucogenicum]
MSVRFRRLGDGEPKYQTAPGDRPRLFNTPDLLQRSADIVITEGEIDCITAHLCGLKAVGVPGAQSWLPHFREPFLGYRTAFILADGDEAGTKFAETVAKTLPNAKVIPMPDGQDVNSFVVDKGPKALLERIKRK